VRHSRLLTCASRSTCNNASTTPRPARAMSEALWFSLPESLLFLHQSNFKLYYYHRGDALPPGRWARRCRRSHLHPLHAGRAAVCRSLTLLCRARTRRCQRRTSRTGMDSAARGRRRRIPACEGQTLGAERARTGPQPLTSDPPCLSSWLRASWPSGGAPLRVRRPSRGTATRTRTATASGPRALGGEESRGAGARAI